MTVQFPEVKTNILLETFAMKSKHNFANELGTAVIFMDINKLQVQNHMKLALEYTVLKEIRS
jgi:hypothetical protein